MEFGNGSENHYASFYLIKTLLSKRAKLFPTCFFKLIQARALFRLSHLALKGQSLFADQRVSPGNPWLKSSLSAGVLGWIISLHLEL